MQSTDIADFQSPRRMMEATVLTSAFVLVFIFAGFCSVLSTAEFKRFIRNKEFDNMTCSYDKIIFDEHFDNRIQCASLCTEPSACVGAFYHPQTKKCVGCSFFAKEQADISNGTQFYERSPQFLEASCGDPPPVAGATLSGTGKVRQYTCGTDMYPLPDKGNGTITCDEDSTSWVPDDFACGGLRLKANPDVQSVQGSRSGYLEMFAEGEWMAVTPDYWTWKATKVACRKLLGINFGGTFHRYWFGTVNPSRLPKVCRFRNIECTGEEEALELCSYIMEKAEKLPEMALTCFEYDFTLSDNVKFYDEDTTTLLTKISNIYGGVCGDIFDDRVATIACRSMNQSWTRGKECNRHCVSNFTGAIHTNFIRCAGDEPHLFYCQNKGWGYHADCDESDLVTLECKM